MATLEIAQIDLPEIEDGEDLEKGAARGRHARNSSLPVYHEDSGEYVSDAENKAHPVIRSFSRGKYKSNVEHDPDPARNTMPMPRIDAVSLVASDALKDVLATGVELEDVAIENAAKDDIRAYLAANSFKCFSSRDAEALSEYAYTPTDKGLILSVKKPFSNANYKRMKALLRRRVKPSRYLHSVLVSETAEKLAEAYGYDPKVARMAGLLHDWDKALSPKRLRDRVAYYDLPIDGATQINMPQLLHGPTGAAVLADEFPEFGPEVFQAIERHTVGGIPMSKLDMIIFCADKIEPSHDVVVYRRLYDEIGRISLRDMFLAVQKEGLLYLLQNDKPMNVDAVEVYNFYAAEKLRDTEDND